MADYSASTVLPVEHGMALYNHAVERGNRVASFVQNHVRNLAEAQVLDVGCGYGGISIAFAARCRRLVALDMNRAKLSLVKQRFAGRDVHHATSLQGDAIHLPFPSGRFDLVVFIGLLEWAGVGNGKAMPRRYQVAAAGEALRVLRPGGHLLVAIENRTFPYNLFRDPHTFQPLVAWLPRGWASRISQWTRGKPYQNYIYSRWGLEKLLKEGGFASVAFYAPLPDYGTPITIVGMDDARAWREAAAGYPVGKVEDAYLRMSQGRWPRVRRAYYGLAGLLRLQGLLAHSLLAIAQKGQGPQANTEAVARAET